MGGLGPWCLWVHVYDKSIKKKKKAHGLEFIIVVAPGEEGQEVGLHRDAPWATVIMGREPYG